MEKKLRIGIVGCGGIANGKHMPALSKLDNVEMVAFCDINKEKADKAAKIFGTPDAKICTDYKEVVSDTTIDVIHVLTPNRSHAEISIAALESGKHVMCEKPMAKTYGEAKSMVEAAKKSGKKLTIGYQHRFAAHNLQLKKICAAGDLGEIYYAKSHAIRRRAVPTWGVFLNEYEQGGGPLIDIGTHALDITLFMMDNYKPVSVRGNIYKKLGQDRDTGNAWGDWDPKEFTVEDSAFGFITMENGATIFLEASWALNTLDGGEAMTTLCGTKAGADTRDYELKVNKAEHGALVKTFPETKNAGVAFYAGASNEPHVLEANAWIDCIVNDKEPMVTPEQAAVVTQILEGIYESARTGKEVFFQ